MGNGLGGGVGRQGTTTSCPNNYFLGLDAPGPEQGLEVGRGKGSMYMWLPDVPWKVIEVFP